MGIHKGITFNTVPPSLINTAIQTDSSTQSWSESSTSFSDCNGQLLVYGSGLQLWNKIHKPLKNGSFTHLDGGIVNFNAPLIPKPNSSRYLYFFYQIGCTEFGCNSNQKMLYAIIDLNGDNGLGEVVSKDNLLDSGSGNNCFTYTIHKNKRDIWLIHGEKKNLTKVFLLTDTGLNRTPVINNGVFCGKTQAYPWSSYRSESDAVCTFKMTHDGKNLISAGIDSSTTKLGCCLMYDFDNSTGKISNAKVLLKFTDIPLINSSNSPPVYGNFYYTEVAPNDTFIYFGSIGYFNSAIKTNSEIWQVNKITLKKTIIKRGKSNYYGLQIGPDGKIYSYETNTIINYLDKPNLQGTASSFKMLLTDSNILINNFPTVYQPYHKLYYYSNLDKNPCQDTSEFNLFVDSNFRQLTVFYGDGDSIEFNSPLQGKYLLKHHYRSTGHYYFKLKALNPDCNSYSYTGDSVYSAIIPKRVPLSKSEMPNCKNNLITLKDSFINTTRVIYSWINGNNDTLDNINSNESKRISKFLLQDDYPNKVYWKLTISNKECINYNAFNDSLKLNFLPIPIVKYSLKGFTSQSFKKNKRIYNGCSPLQLTFEDSTNQLKVGSINWNNYYAFYSTNSPQITSFSKGDYQVEINDTNNSGCVNVDTFYVTSWQKPDANMKVSVISNCIKDNSITVENNSKPIGDSVSYLFKWNQNDSTSLVNFKIFNLKYNVEGRYKLTLKSESINGCKSEIDTFIPVYKHVNADFNINKLSQCSKNNLFQFVPADTNATTRIWLFGDNSNAQSKNNDYITHSYKKFGVYSVNSISVNSIGCSDTIAKIVSVIESPNLIANLNDSIFCLPSSIVKILTNSEHSLLNELKHKVLWGDNKVDTIIGNGSLNHTYNIIDTFKLMVTGTFKECSDTLIKNLIVQPQQKLKLLANGFCFGDSTILRVLANGIAFYNWRVENLIIKNNDSILKFVFPNIGLHKVWVIDSSKCGGKDSISFNIIEKPKADFNYNIVNSKLTNLTYQFNDNSERANSWQWEFNKNWVTVIKNPVFTFSDTGVKLVKLIVTNSNKCKDSMMKMIPVFNQTIFFIPNAFSPDQNGINDSFGLSIEQVRLIKNFKMEIFNRWGELIFNSNDPYEKWRPGDIQNGIYLFKILVTDIYGYNQELSGAINLIR